MIFLSFLKTQASRYCLLLFFLNIVFAQKVIDSSSPKIPSWAIEPPKGKYFIYYTGVGSSPNSLSGAKDQAISNLLSEIIMEGKITANSHIYTFHEESNQKIISQVTREIQQTGETTTIKGLKKEEEYWQSVNSNDGILYQYWILMKILKPDFVGLNINIDQGYGFSAVWRSTLVPGWGQFYKGEPLKGRRLLTTEAACISTSIISYYFSQNYSHKAENERDYDRRKFYNNRSNLSHTIGSISGILAGVFYCYNIFDSITTKGAKKYAHTQQNKWNLFAVNDKNQVSFSINFEF